MEITVGGHFQLKRRIGAGSFGEVFYGEDSESHEEVAIKLERVKTRSPQLIYEAKLYMLFAGGENIPRLRWFGTESNYNVMVIDYLGNSLENLFQMCHKKFSLKTVLMLADQMITSLQSIHSKNFIHRDVKPDNFLMGSSEIDSHKAHKVYVIDFGLSKKYRDGKTFEHIKYGIGKSLTGTARYASVNALKGFEQSRRDDLEAIAYCLIYFLKGKLPWMGLDAKTRHQKYDRIMECKNSMANGNLCKDIPKEFGIFLNIVRNLQFDEEPDYSKYRELFRNLFIENGYVYDYQYDWTSILSQKAAQANNNIININTPNSILNDNPENSSNFNNNLINREIISNNEVNNINNNMNNNMTIQNELTVNYGFNNSGISHGISDEAIASKATFDSLIVESNCHTSNFTQNNNNTGITYYNSEDRINPRKMTMNPNLFLNNERMQSIAISKPDFCRPIDSHTSSFFHAPKNILGWPKKTIPASPQQFKTHRQPLVHKGQTSIIAFGSGSWSKKPC
ncbi:casein kinase I isoform delta-like protein [Tritrichomonas foetus]|uniref:non-specific serine/threonine protein kinase n=1 Tax=Tritrichomonas foetus TaxID=1144522 RepID=A0A1J4KEV4_9EUKA|nr:casein kinase I isoform delta-like protein [Tritrichomonas foetus]|eukprot:OHT09707.1 casein kinase I isoform delta-like protein [Tritrichomonas foetus]